jgi:hypothetical protein
MSGMDMHSHGKGPKWLPLRKTKSGYFKMIKKIKELYQEYRPYVKVDLIMYGVMILLIILYFILSVSGVL